MNMKIIPCAVADFYVRGDGAAVGAAGSHNDVALALTFNETWDGLGKTCVFWDARGEGSVLCVLTDEMRADGAYILPIPAEAKRYAGEIRVTISGTEVSEDGTVAARAMSTTAYFKVLESDFDADALASVEVPASIVEQLLSDAAATRAIADSAISKVKNMTVTAKSGEDAGASVDTTGEAIAISLTLPKGEKGDKGDDFTYDDFTEEQLAELTPKKGVDYWTEEENKAFNDAIFYARDAAERAKEESTAAGSAADAAYSAADDVKEIANSLSYNLMQRAEKGEFDGYTPQRGIDYWTEYDKNEIANTAVDAVMAKTLFIDIKNGYFAPGSSGDNHFDWGDAPEDLIYSSEYGVGCLQDHRFYGVYGSAIFPLSADYGSDDITFAGYDAENDRFFSGTLALSKGESLARFTVTENYMLSKFDAALCGGEW